MSEYLESEYLKKREAEEKKMRKRIFWGVSLVLLLIIFIALRPFTIVDSGERAVILRLGAVDRVLDEGFHYKTPAVENVVTFSVRTEKIEVKAAAASKDLQDVSTVIAVNYNLMPEKVGEIYSEFEKNIQSRVIDPAIQDEVKAITARFTAEELITKRGEVKSAIFDALKARLLESHVDVTQISLTDFTFSASFTQAIEQKVTAAELALKAENDLERVKFEQQQEIEKYKAQAEQTKLQNEALKTGPDFLKLKELEVEMEMAKKWDGKLPTNMYSDMVPFINIPNAAK